MSCKIIALMTLLLAGSLTLAAQQPTKPAPAVDTTITDYDLLFDELDDFLDSLLTPRSFTIISVGGSRRYFNTESQPGTEIRPDKLWVFSPSIGYYDKTGLGLSASATVLREASGFNAFQGALTASYDYSEDRRLLTGFSFTRFITRDSLEFYTSPLQNELNAYFTYRNWWLRPTVSASYGWGSRTAYTEQEERIRLLRGPRRTNTVVTSRESISDFNIVASLRHDFYWLDLLSSKDHIRVTPQLTLTAGTKRYGFNQTSDSYLLKFKGSNVLYNSENVELDEQSRFQPLSVAALLKTEYSFGKVFVQPQVMLDYYLPADSKNLSTIFMINAGVIF